MVASLGFSLLTAATATTRGQVAGDVAGAGRPAYDILVRPSATGVTDDGAADVVPANFQSGIFGGITLDQWSDIQAVSGVEVAAPIANLGYVIPSTDVTVPLSSLVDPGLDEQLFRADLTWAAQAGTTSYAGESDFVYVTKRPDGCLNKFTLAPALYEPFEVQGPEQSIMLCFQYQPSPRDGSPCYLQVPNFQEAVICDPQLQIRVPFPMLLSAVDPVEEDRLVGLSDTLVQGRALDRDERVGTIQNVEGLVSGATAPVLISSRSFTDVSLQVDIGVVQPPPGGSFEQLLTNVNDPVTEAPRFPNAPYVGARALPVSGLQSVTFDAGQLYDETLSDSAGGINVTGYWSAGGVSYTPQADGSLLAQPVEADPLVWQFATGSAAVPLENQDTQYRALTAHGSTGNSLGSGATNLDVVGRFDPSLLPGFDPLTAVPLETYNIPVATPADEASRQALDGSDYLPTRNIGGYLAQPPFLLTTIGVLPELLPYFRDTTVSAPISVIRVRVEGSTGVDEQSLRRIEAVAALIQERTGLQVDVTAGSSPQVQRIDLPASAKGTPALRLEENWVREGVALLILAAVDQKSIVLLGLILFVSAAFLVNAGVASVRSRRGEIGLLLSLGWRRRSVFAAILAELLAVGVLAGTAGTALAFALSATFDLQQPAWRLALVAPTAALLTLLAGLIPAWLASRGQPMDALLPPVRTIKRRSRVTSVLGMALSNLRRNRGRAVLSVACIYVATTALAVLATISLAFQGAVVGTLLGDVIALRVRTADYVSVGLILGLAAFALADLMVLVMRERAVELVTLRVSGWSDASLIQLAATEAVTLGLIGSLLGAATGVAAGAFLGASGQPVLTAAGLSALLGIGITVLAAVAPAVVVARLPIGVASAEA